MMTDPIADMLTRIRNANSIERPAAEMKATKLKANIAQVLKDEGFILDFQVGKYEGAEFKDGAKAGEPGSVLRVYLKYGPEGEKVIRVIKRSSRPGRRYYQGAKAGDPQTILRVYLKYGPEGEKVIRAIHRSSRPGRRYYKGAKDLNKVLDGLGIAVLSTSKGVMSDRKARKEGVGGEVLCLVW